MLRATLLPEESTRLYNECPRTELVYCAHHFTNCEYMLLIFKYVIIKGYIPIVPFLVLPPPILESIGFEQQDFLGHDLRILDKCDRLWIFGEYEDGGVAVEKHWWLHNKYSGIKYIKLEELCENITN